MPSAARERVSPVDTAGPRRRRPEPDAAEHTAMATPAISGPPVHRHLHTGVVASDCARWETRIWNISITGYHYGYLTHGSSNLDGTVIQPDSVNFTTERRSINQSWAPPCGCASCRPQRPGRSDSPLARPAPTGNPRPGGRPGLARAPVPATITRWRSARTSLSTNSDATCSNSTFLSSEITIYYDGRIAGR